MAKLKKEYKYLMVVVGLVLLLYFNLNHPYNANPNTPNSDADSSSHTLFLDWQSDYKESAMTSLSTYNIETQDTVYYDYNHPVIAQASEEIASESVDAKDAIKNSLEYVYKNIKYVVGEADVACYDGVAPNILSSGKGQCDTQSIVLISLLRKMGIAARPVGGCVFFNEDYKLQSFLQSFFIMSTPKYTELKDVELDEDAPYFSRGDNSILSRQGGLHAWVTAWLPNEGWVTLEATNGMFADINSYYYHVEIFPDNNKKEDICVSKNWKYAFACRDNNLNELNNQGLGLANEISP